MYIFSNFIFIYLFVYEDQQVKTLLRKVLFILLYNYYIIIHLLTSKYQYNAHTVIYTYMIHKDVSISRKMGPAQHHKKMNDNLNLDKTRYKI